MSRFTAWSGWAAMVVGVVAAAACDAPTSVVKEAVAAAAPSAAGIAFPTDTLRLPAIGATAPASVRVTDARGVVIPTPDVQWSSADGNIATVAGGLVRAVANGETLLRATVGNVSATLPVVVEPAAAAAGEPRIAGVSLDTVRPGETVTITGANLVGSTVSVGGIPATVTSASATSVAAVLSSTYPCQATQRATLVLTAPGGSTSQEVVLAVANRRWLQPGQSFSATGSSIACNEIAASPGARYVVAVANDGTAAGQATSFRLAGSEAGATAAAVRLSYAGGRGVAVGDAAAPSPHMAALESDRALAAAILAHNRTGPLRTRSERVAAALPGVGDTIAWKIMNFAGQWSCTDYRSVRLRIVYAGPRVVVGEDVANALNGAADSAYVRMAQEAETSQWRTLTTYFGDPLAYNARLQGNGRVFLVFSPKLNAMGFAGFMGASDLSTDGWCEGGNRQETVYLAAPDSAAGVGGWSPPMHAVVVHELKHLAAYAERFSRGASPEESWLEEATAELAMEIWGRDLAGYRQRSNADYGTLRCLIYTSSGCAKLPRPFYGQFLDLRTYLGAPATRTPLGSAGGGDASFYGSGWMFLRWAIDESGSDEAVFLKALVQDGSRTGVANLTARTGRPLLAMLQDYLLALAVDDRPGFTPSNPHLQIASFDLPSIYAGMNQLWGSSVPAQPLVPQSLSTGAFTVDVPRVLAGSGALFDLSGSGAPELLQILSPTGADAPATLGLSVVRVQ